MIADSNFSTLGKPDSLWTVMTHENVEAKASVYAAILTLELSGTRGANWHCELTYSPFRVDRGESIAVSFSARAMHPFTFSVWLGQKDVPYASLVSEENHFGEKKMSSEWQTFSHTWMVVKNEERARLNFVVGQIDNTLEIRDVEFARK